MEVNGNKSYLVANILKYLLICFTEKKEMHKGLEQREGEEIIEFSFLSKLSLSSPGLEF